MSHFFCQTVSVSGGTGGRVGSPSGCQQNALCRIMVPSVVCTPVQIPSFRIRCFALARITGMFRARSARCSAVTISSARSLTGKTRFPRSVFKATPCCSKKSMTSCGEQRDNALYRKERLVGICSRKSCCEQLLVTLQRPFPVMRSFFPICPFCSKITHRFQDRRQSKLQKYRLDRRR